VGKLVLVDGNAILHRAFHALPPLTTKTGEPINAVYGLVSMLLRVIQDLKPTHIAVCFDEKEPTFRHKAFAGYQAQRPHMADELSGQFEKAKKFLEAAAVPVYSKPGYEADDVIGTLASQYKEDVIIVTGDRDILQLVNARIKVYMPIAGLATAKLMGEAEVIEKMGIPPSQIDDYKAFVGDASDNYTGVSGIGPKTAVALLKKYGSLDGAYKHLEELSPQIKEKLKKGREQAALSKKLATIVKDVPVNFDPEAASKWDVDGPKVLDLFQEFGFRTLTERVKKVGKSLDLEKQGSLF
jgi:DNA polymerase-1